MYLNCLNEYAIHDVIVTLKPIWGWNYKCTIWELIVHN